MKRFNVEDKNEIMNLVQRSFNRLKNLDTKEMREQIVDTAISFDDLNVWMETFKDDEDMCKRLSEATNVKKSVDFDYKKMEKCDRRICDVTGCQEFCQN